MIGKLMPQANTDFVVIGDVLIDHIVKIPEALAEEHPRKGTLEIPFPTKIKLSEPPVHLPGGNAYTVSMVLAKLGIKTQIYTVVGNDAPGRRLINKLSQLGVGTNLVTIEEEDSTNSSIILSSNQDRVIFSYHYPRKYRLPELPNAKNIYLTSVGEDDEYLFRQVLKMKRKLKFNLVFSPGSTQMNEDFEEIEPVMKATDLLLVNKSEAQKLANSKSEDWEFLVDKLASIGPSSVVISDGANGSIASHNGEKFQIGALDVEVVEKTGAGDTFSATLCAGLAQGMTITESMQMAAVHAASVIKVIGCEPGLLSWEELNKEFINNQQKLNIN